MFKCDFSANPEPLHLINDDTMIVIAPRYLSELKAVYETAFTKRIRFARGKCPPVEAFPRVRVKPILTPVF